MYRSFLFLFISLALFFSAYPQKTSLKKVKGDRFYGGLLKLNESEYYSSLFPPSATEAVSRRIIPHIYEGLLEYDTENLSLKPSLAEWWEISEDRKIYTFHLVKNAQFHDDHCFTSGKGRPLVATDVEKAFYFLCSSDTLNKNKHLFLNVIKGATPFYKGEEKAIEGIRVNNSFEIEIELEHPSFNFLHILADPAAYIYPDEMIRHYRTSGLMHKAIGSGPFVQKKNEESNSLMLFRNEDYYRKDEYGNQLPYLKQVKISFITDKNLEMEEFKKGNLDLMYRLPPDYAGEIIDEIYYPDPDSKLRKYNIEKVAEYITNGVVFNFQAYPYNNLSFRKAIAHAILSDDIFEYTLNGEGGDVAFRGIVPESLSWTGYDVTAITPVYYNRDSARVCIRRSGFKKNLTPVVLKTYSDGFRNQRVAEAIKEQLKQSINLDVSIVILPLSQLLHEAATNEGGMYLLPLRASYPMPQSLLSPFYGKHIPGNPSAPSYHNYSRYANPLFDKYYESYLQSASEKEGLKHLQAAEQVLIRDCAVSPIWEDAGYYIISKNLKGFYGNAITYWSLRKVYFIK